ncbi:alanine racemase [Mahella australiensis]|uniref:Alanine racemase n=1 Tax=Mahella australiensis (strain DSM 15567 / CIP 107919 / 50-1 BON) TaxID=697281 RepID=F4A306_MAHA5|nr:alanine racemase [Mahella australiensis]AEE97349.1 alanine racemase [Mahella australiensis 50-1 BON]
MPNAKAHSWAEIRLTDIAYNIAQLRRCIGDDTLFMAVVKADGYGHGAYRVAQTAIDAGARWLGVAIAEEGAELRDKGIDAPILVLGGIMPYEAEEVVASGLCQTVFSLDVAKALSDASVKQGKSADVHIKVDTGMGRVGVRPGLELEQLIEGLVGLPGINITGMFTHFAESDACDKSFTKYQMSLFVQAINQAKAMNVGPLILHAANSAAVIDYTDAHFNMVRGGISIYGYYPSNEINNPQKIDLKPALSWKARVVYVKDVPAGTPISYGRTFTTQRSSKIATISAGYADGYRRQLSNKGCVLIRGNRAPVIGRVCMDQFMVDVTDIPGVVTGDEVVLIGRQGNETITADELAELCDTISYEILTSIGPRVPRIYV